MFTDDHSLVNRVARHNEEAAPRLQKAIKRFSTRIAKETLAADIAESKEAGELQKEWDVNGEWARISVERVNRPGSGGSRGGGAR